MAEFLLITKAAEFTVGEKESYRSDSIESSKSM